jgi:hypothetical protein
MATVVPTIASKKLIGYALVITLLLSPVIIQRALAQNCMELGTCTISSLFDFALVPWILTVGDWIYIIVWGLIVGIIYMRAENPLSAGIVGLLLAATFTSATFATEFQLWQNAIRLGLILFSVALAFMLFTILKSKLNNP